MASSKKPDVTDANDATDADDVTTTPTVMALCKKTLEVVYGVVEYMNVLQNACRFFGQSYPSCEPRAVQLAKSEGKRLMDDPEPGSSGKRAKTADFLTTKSLAGKTDSPHTHVDILYMHPDHKWNQQSSNDIFFDDTDVPKELKQKMYLMRKCERHMINRNTKELQPVTAMLWRGVRRHNETFDRFQMILFLKDGKDGNEILSHWYSRPELNELAENKLKAKIQAGDIQEWMLFDNTATDMLGTSCQGSQHESRHAGPKLMCHADPSPEVAAKVAQQLAELNGMLGVAGVGGV
jgi:peptidoglycan/xylan/chitin deacetylase (PgdA/CDA1 family)